MDGSTPCPELLSVALVALLAAAPALGQSGQPLLVPGPTSGSAFGVDRGDNGQCAYQPPGGYEFLFGGLGGGSGSIGGPGIQASASGLFGFDLATAQASVAGFYQHVGGCPLLRGAGSASVTTQFSLRKAAIVQIVSRVEPDPQLLVGQHVSASGPLAPVVRPAANYSIGASAVITLPGPSIASWNASAEAEFRVLAPCTEITLQPGITHPCPGSSAALSVEVVGKGPFSFQWRREDGSLVGSGQTSDAGFNDSVHRATLSIPSVGSGDYGRYFATIQTPLGLCTNVTSAMGEIAAPSLLSGLCCDTSTAACRVALLGCCGGTERFTLGESCEPSPCPMPFGRCCTPGGECCVVNMSDCPSDAFFTPGATCGDNVCIRLVEAVNVLCPGSVSTVRRYTLRGSLACCDLMTGACVVVAPGQACQVGFEPLLGKVTCEPVACPNLASIAGACCVNGFCTLVGAPVQCQSPGMRFRPDLTSCDPLGGVSVCCRADIDASGGLAIGDIFAYLNVWFAGTDPRADFSADGSVSLHDIFDFLNAWFAGCP